MICKFCKKNILTEYHECDYVGIRDELYCKHSVGHSMESHGCDGCCSTKEWKEAWKRLRK